MTAVETAIAPIDRYTRVAILLHWVIALLIILQIGVGFWLADAFESTDQAARMMAFEQAQIHKSVGLTILGLSLLRLLWRLLNPAPPLPEDMSGFERAAATMSHVGFYALMILMPLSGWAMVSSSVEFASIPTVYFGAFEIPHLPMLPGLEAEAKASVNGAAHEAHELLALGALALLALHVAAALKHHFVNGDGVLARMVPGVRPRGAPSDAPKRAYRARVGPARIAMALVLTAAAGGAVFGLSKMSALKQTTETAQGGGEASVEMAGMAQAWGVVHSESALTFLTANSGTPVEGAFKSWKALIEFDPDNLEQSEVVVIVDIASAATGDLLYDGSLTEPDWFDAEAHPKGSFVAQKFSRGDGEGAYVAHGSLTLRGVEKPFDLPFQLSIDGDRAEVTGEAVIDRSAFGIGVNADPDGAWVPLDVTLKIDVVAKRAE